MRLKPRGIVVSLNETIYETVFLSWNLPFPFVIFVTKPHSLYISFENIYVQCVSNNLF